MHTFTLFFLVCLHQKTTFASSSIVQHSFDEMILILLCTWVYVSFYWEIYVRHVKAYTQFFLGSEEQEMQRYDLFLLAMKPSLTIANLGHNFTFFVM